MIAKDTTSLNHLRVDNQDKVSAMTLSQKNFIEISVGEQKIVDEKKNAKRKKARKNTNTAKGIIKNLGKHIKQYELIVTEMNAEPAHEEVYTNIPTIQILEDIHKGKDKNNQNAENQLKSNELKLPENLAKSLLSISHSSESESKKALSAVARLIGGEKDTDFINKNTRRQSNMFAAMNDLINMSQKPKESQSSISSEECSDSNCTDHSNHKDVEKKIMKNLKRLDAKNFQEEMHDIRSNDHRKRKRNTISNLDRKFRENLKNNSPPKKSIFDEKQLKEKKKQDLEVFKNVGKFFEIKMNKKNSITNNNQESKKYNYAKDDLMAIEYQRQIDTLNSKISNLKEINRDYISSNQTMVFDKKFVEMMEACKTDRTNILKRSIPAIKITPIKQLTESVFKSFNRLVSFIEIIHSYMLEVSRHMSDNFSYLNEGSMSTVGEDISDINTILQEYFKEKKEHKLLNSVRTIGPSPKKANVKKMTLDSNYGTNLDFDRLGNFSVASQDDLQKSLQPKNSVKITTGNKLNFAQSSSIFSGPLQNQTDTKYKTKTADQTPNNFGKKSITEGFQGSVKNLEASKKYLASKKVIWETNPVNASEHFEPNMPRKKNSSQVSLPKNTSDNKNYIKHKNNKFYFSSNEILKIPALTPILETKYPSMNEIENTQSYISIMNSPNGKNSVLETNRQKSTDLSNYDRIFKNIPYKVAGTKTQPNLYELKDRTGKNSPNIFYSTRDKKTYKLNKNALNNGAFLDSVPQIKLNKHSQKNSYVNTMTDSVHSEYELDSKVNFVPIEIHRRNESHKGLTKKGSLKFQSQHNLIRQVFEIK